MKLLIIDCETNGVDDDSELIEVGAVLYSVEHQTILAQVSCLAASAKHNEAERINKIPFAALGATASESAAKNFFFAMISEADYCVAHNAEFDKRFVISGGKTWLCTMENFAWPSREHVNGKSLVTIALEHGIGVSTAHRALTDCQLIAEIFNRQPDLPSLIQTAIEDATALKAFYRADVSYDDRHLPKEAGFRWNQPGFPKMWIKKIRCDQAGEIPFAVTQVSNPE